MTESGSGPTPSPVAMADAPSPAADAEQNKAVGIIAYLSILWLIPLLTAKDSRFAMFHANQGLVLFLCFDIALFVCGAIPPLWLILMPIVGLVRFVFMILGMVNAANGTMKPLPLIGGIQILK